MRKLLSGMALTALAVCAFAVAVAPPDQGQVQTSELVADIAIDNLTLAPPDIVAPVFTEAITLGTIATSADETAAVNTDNQRAITVRGAAPPDETASPSTKIIQSATVTRTWNQTNNPGAIENASPPEITTAATATANALNGNSSEGGAPVGDQLAEVSARSIGAPVLQNS